LPGEFEFTDHFDTFSHKVTDQRTCRIDPGAEHAEIVAGCIRFGGPPFDKAHAEFAQSAHARFEGLRLGGIENGYHSTSFREKRGSGFSALAETEHGDMFIGEFHGFTGV